MSLRFLPARASARRASREPEPAQGLPESDLDAAWGHFGPTCWCDDERVWREQLATDRPARVFLLADDGRGPRLVASFDWARVPDGPDLRLVGLGHARLKYYRAERGWTVAVSRALDLS